MSGRNGIRDHRGLPRVTAGHSGALAALVASAESWQRVLDTQRPIGDTQAASGTVPGLGPANLPRRGKVADRNLAVDARAPSARTKSPPRCWRGFLVRDLWRLRPCLRIPFPPSIAVPS